MMAFIASHERWVEKQIETLKSRLARVMNLRAEIQEEPAGKDEYAIAAALLTAESVLREQIRKLEKIYGPTIEAKRDAE